MDRIPSNLPFTIVLDAGICGSLQTAKIFEEKGLNYLISISKSKNPHLFGALLKDCKDLGDYCFSVANLPKTQERQDNPKRF